MRKGISYKLITLAVGIVVAIVIVLTLWIEIPQPKVSSSHPKPDITKATAAKIVLSTTSRLIKNTVNILTGENVRGN
jgi:hypothetical protein